MGDATDGEEDPTCGVNNNCNDITQQTMGHIDLCGTDPRLLLAASQRERVPNDIASWLLRCEGFPIKSLETHEINFKIGVFLSPLLIPRP